MKPKFKNITKCSKELYNQFLQFHANKYGKKYKAETIIVIIALIYMIVFNIIYGNILMFLFIGIIFIIYILYKKVKQKKIVKKELKTSKIKNEEDIIFNFYNYYFDVILGNKKQRLRYYKLKRIHNDERNFYLYIEETQAFIVSKNGFINDKSKEFDIFISKKCRFKYKKNRRREKK